MKRLLNCLTLLLCVCSLTSQLLAKTSHEIDLSPFHFQEETRLGNYTVAEVEEKFRIGMKEYLKGPEGSWRLRFYPTPSTDVLKGKFNYVEVLLKESAVQGLEDLKLRRGRVMVESVEFDIDKLMSQGKLEVKNIENIQFNIRIDEKDINEYLQSNQQQINLRSPSLKLSPEKMLFSARVKNRFFSARVRTEGHFEVAENGKSVNFQARNVSLNSLPIPGFVTGKVVSRINPVLNLEKFALMEVLPLNLDKIHLGYGYVEFRGK